MASVATPEWLARRAGSFRESTIDNVWLVELNGEPQYRLTPVPASGQFACQVVQTVNGRRLDGPETYPSVEAALQGGLETLQKTLGW